MDFQRWISRLGTEIIPLEVNYFQALGDECTPEHTHPGQLHIACFEKGSGWCMVNGIKHRIHSGDIYLILPGEMHQFSAEPDNPYRACFLHFSWFGELPAEIPLTLKVPRSEKREFFALCSRMADICHKGDRDISEDFFFYGELLHFWGLLLRYAADAGVSGELLRPKEGINKQLNQIVSKLHGPPFFYPGIDTLAEESGISRRQLTKLFRKFVGCGIKQYYLANVMHYAKSIREQKVISVAELAKQCGYSTPQNFLLAYKKFFSAPEGKDFSKSVVWTPTETSAGKTISKK